MAKLHQPVTQRKLVVADPDLTSHHIYIKVYTACLWPAVVNSRLVSCRGHADCGRACSNACWPGIGTRRVHGVCTSGTLHSANAQFADTIRYAFSIRRIGPLEGTYRARYHGCGEYWTYHADSADRDKLEVAEKTSFRSACAGRSTALQLYLGMTADLPSCKRIRTHV